jgi:hypothetical protein
MQIHCKLIASSLIEMSTDTLEYCKKRKEVERKPKLILENQ